MTVETLANIEMSLICQAMASVFIAIFMALTAILFMALLEYRRILEMDREYDDLAESREVFWDALRLAYDGFQEANPESPERLEDLILTEGFPPEFQPQKVDDPSQWIRENEDRLEPLMLWKFASTMYPSRHDQQRVPVGHGIIKSEYAGLFHEARGMLVRFWNKWVPLNQWAFLMMYFRPMRYLCVHYAPAHNQLIMLTWLELALIRRVTDHGRKEIALFKLAAKFAKNSSQA